MRVKNLSRNFRQAMAKSVLIAAALWLGSWRQPGRRLF